MGARSLQVPLDDPEAAADAIVAHDALAPLDAVVAVDDSGHAWPPPWPSSASACATTPPRPWPPPATSSVMRARLERGRGPPARLRRAPRRSRRLTRWRRWSRRVGLPCVIKPTTLAGSQGVLRADTPRTPWPSSARVRRIAAGAAGRPRRPLAGRALRRPAPRWRSRDCSSDGDLRLLAVFDKPDPLDGPAFEETIYVTPSRLGPGDLAAVRRRHGGRRRRPGSRRGPRPRRDPRARRAGHGDRSGGAHHRRAVRRGTLAFSTGRTLEELVIAHALGLALGPTRRRARASGVLMMPIPRAGDPRSGRRHDDGPGGPRRHRRRR